MDKEQIDQWFTEIAPDVEASDVFRSRHDDQESWTMVLEDGLLIDIFEDQQAVSLMASIELGVPAPSKAAQVHVHLLQYNALWRETQGARMALDALTGEVYLLYQIRNEDTRPSRLRDILVNLVIAARAWKEKITKADDNPSEPTSSDFSYYINRI
ncbi:MAG: type III secretion system chaperone [Alphaproteobacteria bacterium]|nr:type III secretion system chaperone [Alphaproteobacteria bacterium]